MATNVTVNAGQGSTQVTVITGEGSTSYSISAGARGPAGADGTIVIVDQTVIDGSANAVSGNAVFDAIALKAPLASPTFTGIVTAPRITGRCDGLEVLCKAGLAIAAGQVVYVTGASGNNIVIGLARANAEETSSKTIGISESTLANNATGYVITEGLMTVSISAPTANEGDPIWLSSATAGSMVFGLANKPSAPNHIVYLGVVTRKTGNTVVEIYVKVQNGAELDELSDVSITSPVAGQALMRGASLWENRALVSSDISNATSAATPNTLVLRNASGDASFGAINASSTITTTGDYATISTNGVGAYVSTFGADAFISTSGINASISTSGSNADIFTVGDDATISTSGANATIFTTGANSQIYTEGADASIGTSGLNAYFFTTGDNATLGTYGENATMFTFGANATISTIGNLAHISTSGDFANIFTSGTDASISTSGAYGNISTLGSDALISTYGENAYITTNGANAYIATEGSSAFIQSRSTFNLFNGSKTTTLSHAPTDDRAIAFPNASGTVALINPSTGTQTFSGAQSFSGQVEFTGQAATNATSAMTRALVDERVMPQAHLPSRFVVGESDFNSTTLNTAPYGNAFTGIGAPGGTATITFAPTECNSNHPGVISLSTGGTANSGNGVSTSALLPIVFGGGEEYILIFKPVHNAATTRCRIGFAATIATTAPNYIAFAEGVGDGAGNVVFSAITANFSGGTTNTTTNATTYSAALGVWYQMRVVVNASAASVSFYLYSESGTLLWSVTNSTNVPTSNVQAGFTFYNTTLIALTILAYADYHKFEINRTLIR